MESTVISRNLKRLGKSLSNTINYLDLDYRAVHSSGDFILRGGKPIINQYKLWLQSGNTDYIRNYGFGGFFSKNLNEYKFSPDSEALIENDLKAKTAELFPDIYIISCEVKCMSPKKFWKVKVMIGDKNTGMIIDDMIKNGESLVFDVNSMTVN